MQKKKLEMEKISPFVTHKPLDSAIEILSKYRTWYNIKYDPLQLDWYLLSISYVDDIDIDSPYFLDVNVSAIEHLEKEYQD